MVCGDSKSDDPADVAAQQSPEPPDPPDETENMTDYMYIQYLAEQERRDHVVQVPRWCFFLSVIFFVAVCGVAIIVAVEASIKPRYWVPPELLDSMGVEGIIMFRQYDRDADGVLSMDEFEPLAHRLLELNDTFDYDEPIGETDEVITVRAHFKPLLLSSLSKDMKVTAKSLDPLRGLKMWKNPEVQWKNFAASHFSVLLPPDSFYHKVGHTYMLTGLPEGMEKGTTLSSNRYYPPHLVDGTEVLLHRLLAMLHPRPFVISRFAPQGAHACVRAVSDKYIDVVFRVHAEFQLNHPPFHPFWFTPGQFTGRLIMSRDLKHVRYFNLSVPGNNKLNVDMEFLIKGHGENSMEVDIGFLPQMELVASHPSLPAVYQNTDMRDIPLADSPHEIDSIQWDKEISVEDAVHKVEVQFLPFKKVPYHGFTEAFSRAAMEQKLVHSVILWGALDDQSC